MAFSGLSVVFDLDGTLVDTAADLADAMNAVLVEAKRPPVPPAQVRHLVGRGARALIEAGFQANGAALPPDDVDRHVAHFLDHYARNLVKHTRPYDRAVEIASYLRAHGAKLGICTNKPHKLTMALLAGLGIAPLFDGVLGADAVKARKPDGRHVLDVIARMEGDVARAVMVGDSEVDVAAARGAKIPIVLVDHGYTAVPARDLGGDRVISEFTELPGAIEGVMSRA